MQRRDSARISDNDHLPKKSNKDAKRHRQIAFGRSETQVDRESEQEGDGMCTRNHVSNFNSYAFMIIYVCPS